VFDTRMAWDRSGKAIRQHFPKWYIPRRNDDLKRQ